MAIQFARIEIVSRASGGNACCKGSYNARTKVKDQQTGVIYDFQKKGDNVHHEILLPTSANRKFYNVSEFMNLIERSEKRKDSQLLKDILLALPDDKELNLQDRIEITHRLIEKRKWITEGLGVQVDIHQPHDGEKNWHAHLLVTTRRFTEDGLAFGAKAVDLNPDFKKAGNKAYIVPEDQQIHEDLKEIINDYFKELGLDNRVDSIGINPQEHIGPVRMRSVLNQAAERNEERRLAEIEHLSNGARVLDKVTRHMSIFSRGDLIRAAKYIPNIETREKLVEDALANQSLIALYKEDGTKTGTYTTQEIRAEENKVLRLCSYVANSSNVFNSSREVSRRTKQLILEHNIQLTEGHKLTEEQKAALTEALTSESALHIIRGRAGTGKSHVLRQIACIAKASNINAIGLSPTHKAKEALAAEGFARTDTVKGMLFKLHNAKFSLPKNSLLVVDEAGMISNDDYSELLRVAATRKCTVILSGDERQLASVQRGGMFEIFADRYGSSTILDIRRQDSGWGKDIAMAFSEGNVESGVAILERENRIKWQADEISSMQELLSDWQRSSYAIDDKVILAVKNKDVAALNHGVRQYLKAEGKLTGQEIEVAGNHYMKGDRIVIQKTNKDLEIVNGDLGVILEVSKDRFIISIGQTGADTIDAENKLEGGVKKEVETKIIEFNPSEYNSFRHSYVTTIFKAQGASIKDVYVYHSGFAGLRNSYVALSRHISELNLYVNEQATSGIKGLIKQLSYDHESGSSLNYLTQEELNNHQENAETLKNVGAIDRVIDNFLLGAYNFVERGVRKITDKYLPKSEYYNYKEPTQKTESVEQILDKVYERYEQNQHIGFAVDDIEERMVVGGNVQVHNNLNSLKVVSKLNQPGSGSGNISNAKQLNIDSEGSKNLGLSTNISVSPTTTKQSAKERFYARADVLRNKEQNTRENIERYKEEYRAHIDKLRGELRFNAESVALNLLGTPNRKLSTKSILKYGNKGSLAVRISGTKAGTWYDFEKGEGGDMFGLVQQEKRCDFKDSVEYLSDFVGISRSQNVNVVRLHNVNDRYADHHKERAKIKAAEAAKIKKAENLYSRSKIIDRTSTASRYLVKTRRIDFEGTGSEIADIISKDIRTTSIYEKSLDKRLPAIIAFARDKDGNITGGQQLLLDSKTLSKASIPTSRKSFGKIASSFVEISNPNNDRTLKKNVENNTGDNLGNNSARHLASSNPVHNDTVTIIAEGLETALSIQYAGIEGKIICALGISNIKNYVPRVNEKIIIAADNDGENASTNNTISEAKALLLSQSACVAVVRPQHLGDFNDILQRSEEAGILEIRESFNPVIGALTAKTLDEFFANEDKHNPLFGHGTEANHTYAKVQEDLAYIRKYNISEELLLNSFKDSHTEGLEELNTLKEKVVFSEQIISGQGKQIIDEAKLWDSGISESQLINELITLDQDKQITHLKSCRNDALNNHIKTHYCAFEKAKIYSESVVGLLDIVKKEQAFLSGIIESMQDQSYNYKLNDKAEIVVSVAQSVQRKSILFEEVRARAENYLDKGIMRKEEVSYLFKYELDMNKMNQTMDTSFEDHLIRSNLGVFREAKFNAKDYGDLLRIFKTEQEFLISLDGKIKNSTMTSKTNEEIALTKENQKEQLLEKLEIAIEYSLKNKLQASWEIVKDLKLTKDLKSTYIELDKPCENHYIRTNLELFKNEKEQAKSSDALFTAIAKEQSFLNDLSKNIKYPDKDEHLLTSIAKARSSKEENILPQLQELMKNVISQSVMDESSMCQELQKSSDLKSTYVGLDKVFERHHIETNLSVSRKEKVQANTPSEIISVIAKEQDFLSSLHDNLKYPEEYSIKLLDSIKNAREGQDTIAQDLHQVTSHILKHQVMPEQDLVKILQETRDAHVTSIELTQTCRNHYTDNTVAKNVNLISINRHLEINGNKFNCPIEYLKHEIANPAHAYVDIARLKRDIPLVQERIHGRDMGGMSM